MYSVIQYGLYHATDSRPVLKAAVSMLNCLIDTGIGSPRPPASPDRGPIQPRPKRDRRRRHPPSNRDPGWAVARPTSHPTATHSGTRAPCHVTHNGRHPGQFPYAHAWRSGKRARRCQQGFPRLGRRAERASGALRCREQSLRRSEDYRRQPSFHVPTTQNAILGRSDRDPKPRPRGWDLS